MNRFTTNSFATTPLLRFRTGMIVAIAALLFGVPALSLGQTPNPPDPDHSIKPGDDFYGYANGAWLKTVTIPAGQPAYDNRAMLMDKTSNRVRDLIQDAAATHTAKGSVAQKVGDYYASVMDEDAIEAKKMTPLVDEMAHIAAITNKGALSAYLGTTLNGEVDGLIANSDHVFGLWINQSFTDRRNVVHLWQGGLGLPDRDNYIDASPKMAELRTKYQSHIAAVLKLAGIADPDAKAARVLALETGIAKAFAPDADAADVFKQNNPWKRTNFAVKAPGMDWDAYFTSAGLSGQSEFVVWQPSAVTGVSALVESESIDVWKNYLICHLFDQYATVLPKAVAAEHFAFYITTLSGNQQVTPDRTQFAIAATNGALGLVVAQLYAQRYFPPEAKAKAQDMAGNLVAAYRARISNLTWMSPQTKEKALAKLAALEVIVGYPDTWIDYSTLDVVRGDAFGNIRRAEAFLRARNLTKLKEPVDPIEWPINPQVPGAVIMFSPNAEFFTAGILQPPYFDPSGDAASNYGSAGAGMAHEISHSFDELGNIYDAEGRLGGWWSAADRDQFHQAAAKLAAQMTTYCPFSDLCINGKQVLTESVADMAGLLVAHDAYILSLKGKPDVVIGGLSGDQRFFLAFAQRWRKLQGDVALRKQIATDNHLPGLYRSDSVRNVDDWYKAYEVTPSDKLYLKPQDRVRIW